MSKSLPDGVFPVMLTPFSGGGQVDYPALGALVEWYIENGVDGLFAVCQSSEMFCLSLEERVNISRFVVEKVAGRVAVVASGHISDDFEAQVGELRLIGGTGVDAVVMLSNRMAACGEPDEVWIENTSRLIDALDPSVPLGLYECPFPYKRVLSEKLINWCVKSGRFAFLKDTSCDIENIRMKLGATAGTAFRLYNANTSTLLESLLLGANGYSGVMANFHPLLYSKLCRDLHADDARKLADELTMLSLIERQYYPINAKYYLSLEGLPIKTACRSKEADGLTETFKQEVRMLRRITGRMYEEYL